MNGSVVMHSADKQQKSMSVVDGRVARQKGSCVRKENIRASCVSELAINQLVCSAAGLALNSANIIKSNGELTRPKISVTILMSFPS